MAVLTAARWSCFGILVCVSLIISDFVHHFMCFLKNSVSSICLFLLLDETLAFFKRFLLEYLSLEIFQDKYLYSPAVLVNPSPASRSFQVAVAGSRHKVAALLRRPALLTVANRASGEVLVWGFTLEYKAPAEKAMAPHSSPVAWKIPWMEEPGGLQSMGSLRVGHDWATSLSLSTFMPWRRKWQPTPVFLPGESQGRRSLVGCRPWGRTESDTTEAT